MVMGYRLIIDHIAVMFLTYVYAFLLLFVHY